MNARTQPPTGFVTVAQAAAELTKRGDPIDPSNVSRYLARWPDVPSEKIGKFRYVDLASLAAHRAGNVLSIEKRTARDAEPLPLAPPARSAPTFEDDDAEGETGKVPVGPEIQQANLRLKLLQVREKEREDELAEGQLVRADEVSIIVSAAMQSFVEELERAEVGIASRHGREVAADFRRSRKAAQAKAAERMKAAAQKTLHPAVAQRFGPDEVSEVA